METFAVDGFSETKLALALFKNVKNATDLKSKHLNRVALLDAGTASSMGGNHHCQRKSSCIHLVVVSP